MTVAGVGLGLTWGRSKAASVGYLNAIGITRTRTLHSRGVLEADDDQYRAERIRHPVAHVHHSTSS